MLLTAAGARAADVTLGWDYPHPGAAGFALYCGPRTQYYLTRTEIGGVDTCTVQLADGQVHFCAIAAYDAAGRESSLSNEVTIAVDEVTGAAQVVPTLSLASAGAVTPTATGVHVQFNAPFLSTWANLYETQARGEGRADVVLQSDDDEDPVAGSLAIDQDARGFTFVMTGGTLPPGNYTLTLRGLGSFIDSYGRPLDTDGDGYFGDDYQVRFAVGASTGPVLSIGEFARGPGQVVNLPNADPGAGIPIYLSQGAAVRDVVFTLRYNPTMLSVKGVTLGSSVHGQLSIDVLDAQAGRVVVRVRDLAGLTNTRTALVRLQAEVPSGARYAGQHLLDLRELAFNGGVLAGRDDDGLHIVAYVGDANGDGSYSASDNYLIKRVIVMADTGFSAFPLIDPVVVADTNPNGRLESVDTRLLQLKILLVYVPEIPDLPEEE